MPPIALVGSVKRHLLADRVLSTRVGKIPNPPSPNAPFQAPAVPMGEPQSEGSAQAAPKQPQEFGICTVSGEP